MSKDLAWIPPPVGGTRDTSHPKAPFIDLHGKTVLVTGGAGFVGHNFIKLLVQKFRCRVKVIDNLWRGSLDNLRGLIDLEKDFVKADLTDPRKCDALIRDVDVVYHLADIVAGVDFVFSNQPFVFRNNLLINTNVLGSCVKNGIKNYVYVGTACSFPQHLQMVMDDSIVALHEKQTYPAEPESSYGWSKLMGEYEANLAQQSGALNVGLLRLHNIYGPGSPYDPQRSQALPSLIRKSLSDTEEFSVWGSGEQYRDFLYIDDVCNALVLMAEKGMNQGVIQIGTGEACRLKDAANIVANLAKKIAGRDVAIKFDRSKPEGDRGRIAINERAVEVLGWHAQVSIEEGLERTFRWIYEDMQKPKPVEPPKAAPFIPQMVPWFDEAEGNHLAEYMESGAFLTEFKKTQEFEQMICDYTGAKHCIAVNNGTISLSIALLAVGVQAGDDVLVPDWTMVATPNSAKLIGANPVFVDIDPTTWCIDIDEIEKAITPKTKAIIHVQMNARSNDIERLAALCKARGIGLVEDSAQALGSFHKGRHLGRFGQVASFSFSSPKIISTGQGGALITDDDEVARRIRKMKDFGRNSGGNDTHDIVGWNFKFTDMQAVVGIEQMKKLPWRVTRMRQIFELYRKHLHGIRQVTMNDHDLREAGWIPWFVDIFVDDRDALQRHLKAKGVGTRAVYPPIHKQEAYQERNNLHYPVTEYTSARGMWLPSSSKLTDAEIIRVCDTIREYYQHKDTQQSRETVLVVGGAGYLGSSTVMRLMKETNFNVKAFDALMYEGSSLFPFFAFKNRFSFVQGDLRTVNMDELLQGVTMVVNFCALVGEPICKKFPEDAVQINLDANLALARACERHGVKRFVFSSTCSNYGTQEGLLPETAELQPISIYADTKVKSEKYLMEELPKLPCSILRFSTAYGLAARVRFDLLLHEFIRDAWTEKEIKIFGADGWRPLCHVDDLSRAVVTVFEQTAALPKKDVYNIGSNDQNVTKRMIGEMVAKRLGCKLNIVGDKVKVDPRSYRVDFSKFEKATGFRALLRPQDAINDIAIGLESGAIGDKILYEAVNVPVNESVQEIAKAELKKIEGKSRL